MAQKDMLSARERRLRRAVARKGLAIRKASRGRIAVDTWLSIQTSAGRSTRKVRHIPIHSRLKKQSNTLPNRAGRYRLESCVLRDQRAAQTAFWSSAGAWDAPPAPRRPFRRKCSRSHPRQW